MTATPTPFRRPPTLPASPSEQAFPVTPVASPTPAEPTPTTATTPPCTDGLSFVRDLTIPDGTLVAPGQSVDKQWLVTNSGDCNWDARYRLKLASGPDMGAPTEQALYPARAGTQATIRILFTAPQEAGTYRSAWQAFNPQGEPFGDPIYVEVVVSP